MSNNDARKESQASEPDQRQPLDVDDDEMWSATRRTPLSGDALGRIALRVKAQRQPRAMPARWRVWAAASLLLLIGGAAGAGVATFVIKRPLMSSLTDADAKRSRAWTQPPRARSRVNAPAPAPTPPAAPVAPALPPVEETPRAVAPLDVPAHPGLMPVSVPGPTTNSAAVRQKRSAPVQVATRDTVVAAPIVTVPPPPAPPTGPGAEARILRSALTAARRDDNPAAALALLDQYDSLFPRGTLRAESTLARAYSLRRLGRDDELLQLLERVPFAGMPRAAELRVLRGELLMTRGRFADAMNDFEATLAGGPSDGFAERALFGRASCRSHLGDSSGARADLTRYLERFPTSPRAAEVRATLAR